MAAVSAVGGDVTEAWQWAGGWRLLFEAHPKPMWVCEARTLRFLAVNEEALRQYGYPRDRFLSMTMLELVPPADAGALLAHMQGGDVAPGATAGVWRHVRRDGWVMDVEMWASALSFDGADARLVLAHDITDRRRLHAALQASEQRFTRVFANAPVAQATLSLDGRLLQVNPALCQMTGYDEGELVGEPASLVLDATPAPAGGHLLALLAGGAPSFQAETQLRRKDGAALDVDVSAARVSDDAGRATRTVVLVLDVTERKAAERRLAHQALHDPLTHLPNRGLFVDRLEQGLRRLERGDHLLAVLFVDLDRFKPINDRWGHAVGDQVLCEVARRLRHVLRPHDTVARLGGDEFTILCEDLSGADEVHEVAMRVLETLAAPVRVEDQEIALSASVGVALTDGGCVADQLLRDADAAMYEAKGRGRNRYEVFDQAMRERTSSRLEQTDALRRALDEGELRVFFQPEVQLSDESTSGVEALVRWDHPRLGLIGPDAFIPVAEDSGLILPLGEWVLREACRNVAAWPVPPGGRPPVLSVNLSAQQLARPELVDSVVRILAETGLDPARLCLEITESVLMDDVESAIEALLGLKLLGVRLAIDDFGTGYSSLSYLRRFAVDVVKVDRSFVAGLGVDPAAEAIVAAVVNLCHALGLDVVAEGVESQEQLVALRALGCDRAQGYRWSPPLPASQFRQWEETPRPAMVAPTSVDVRALLVRRVDALRAATGRSVVIQAPAALPSAFADAGALKAIVDHLLGNAVSYSGRDRPIVVVASSDRRWVRVSVSDFGIGMTPEQASRCFEQFWQAAVPEERRSGGTGVGLYMVRSLVEAMGGRVSVRTAAGKGSTFTVALPRSARALARACPPDGAGLDVGEQSVIHEFMRQIGVPMRRPRP